MDEMNGAPLSPGPEGSADQTFTRKSPVSVCDPLNLKPRRSLSLTEPADRTLSSSAAAGKRQCIAKAADLTPGVSGGNPARDPVPQQRPTPPTLQQLPSASATAGSSSAAAQPPPHQIAAAGRKVALVVGIDYTGSLKHKLCFAVKDARDVCDKLRRMDFEVVLLEEPDIDTFRQKVRTFIQSLQPQDVSLFYFAGHGVEAEVCCGGHMVPSNWLIGKELPAENDDLPLKAIDAFKMLREMEAKPTLFNVIILDCCRDDPLPGYALGAGGLRRMEPKKSLVVFACEPGKRSAELPRADNGVFAKHLLRHIETPNLRVDDLFIRVRNDVNKATKSFPRGMQDPCCFYALKEENAMLLPQ